MTTYVLAACSQQPPAGPDPVGTEAPVIVPGSPGAPGRTATPGERVGQTPAPTVAADVRFAEAMIPHHRQALEMTALVDDRTTTATIRSFARQITAAQTPEIRTMTGWLAELGRRPPAAHEHEDQQAAAYGMATTEQLNALRAARGTAFDRMFLQLMTRHHEGAVKMAGEELAAGRDQRMRLLAKDVYSGQSIEIARMRKVLEDMPA
ncbi:DUF305 domain-containing protein [Nonomuraea phyllanthi]|uniref:DUF305 domain-containing protein n=1 Tax=Nonomuraea phyllanthi TaxID=2219224 RepID=A0A5C4WCU5_9ACTN|nr:DUF305 domain-containing protein [Nonomuraea phyllanthi]KAB8193194.1 DUF305 domain-containing protein [Nonomuraea phyllanthi]QFY10945.1 DUF305 domain-containing protein [Nonomuraea phyllanthi]